MTVHRLGLDLRFVAFCCCSSVLPPFWAEEMAFGNALIALKMIIKL